MPDSAIVTWRIQLGWYTSHRLGPHWVAKTEEFITQAEAEARREWLIRNGIKGLDRDGEDLDVTEPMDLSWRSKVPRGE